ncbi:MAG: S8 family serine peptidase, partial [Gaiellaceae bacterium]
MKPTKAAGLLAVAVLVSGAVAEAGTGGERGPGTPRMTWRSQRVNGKAAPHHPMRSLPRYVPGEVIVEFRGQLPAGAQERIARSVDGQVRHLIPELNQQVVTLPSSSDPLAASQLLSS